VGLILAIALTAAGLRPALTSVGPLIEDIQAALALSAATAGLLTTLPLLAFALLSAGAGPLAGRLGMERTLAAAMAVVAFGILLRSAGGTPAVFAGTAVLGAGIAAGNVLLPGLVKLRMPDRSGPMTSFYVTILVAFAGLAAAVAVPLADDAGLGWRGALAVWAAPVAAGSLVWLPWLRRGERHAPGHAEPAPLPWRSALAWQVTLFMGLQSLLFYALVAWLPAILGDAGVDEATAGLLFGVSQAASLVATVAVPIMAERAQTQFGLVAVATVLCLAGFGVLLAAPAELALLVVVLLGVGTGVSFALALILFVLRAGTVAQATALSGMAQAVGYGLAALGPLLLGAGRDAAGSWQAPLLALVAVTLLMGAVGAGAARDRTIG
jgi:CP family cyanate transporter-like MFS transporter